MLSGDHGTGGSRAGLGHGMVSGRDLRRLRSLVVITQRDRKPGARPSGRPCWRDRDPGWDLGLVLAGGQDDFAVW